MKIIYFHIGLPKTGTSYLQSAFAINSDRYREFNLQYPDLGGNFWEAAIGKTTSGNGVGIAASSGIEELKNIGGCDIAELCQTFDPSYSYLISSEWLCECPQQFFEHINNVFSKKFKVKYLAFIRNSVDRISSYYQQSLKTGHFSGRIECHIDELIAKERRLLNLLISLSGSINVLNYDNHKESLLTRIDEILFERSVSRKPEFSSVNPSPKYHQTEILRLVNRLGLSDYEKAIGYIESAQDDHSKEVNYVISRSICEKIFSELKSELDGLNSILPEGEKINNHCYKFTEINLPQLFTDADVDFLSDLIKQRLIFTQADFDWIIKSVTEIQPSCLSILPSEFNVLAYMLRNSDIVRARVDPIRHYLDYGIREGRSYK